jgi:hypothetical protein
LKPRDTAPTDLLAQSLQLTVDALNRADLISNRMLGEAVKQLTLHSKIPVDVDIDRFANPPPIKEELIDLFMEEVGEYHGEGDLSVVRDLQEALEEMNESVLEDLQFVYELDPSYGQELLSEFEEANTNKEALMPQTLIPKTDSVAVEKF